jgi:hypothetical protein
MTYQCRHWISFHPTAREEADINVYVFGPFAPPHRHPPERLILLHGLHCRLPTGGRYKVILLERAFGRRPLVDFLDSDYKNTPTGGVLQHSPHFAQQVPLSLGESALMMQYRFILAEKRQIRLIRLGLRYLLIEIGSIALKPPDLI